MPDAGGGRAMQKHLDLCPHLPRVLSTVSIQSLSPAVSSSIENKIIATSKSYEDEFRSVKCLPFIEYEFIGP